MDASGNYEQNQISIVEVLYHPWIYKFKDLGTGFRKPYRAGLQDMRAEPLKAQLGVIS